MKIIYTTDRDPDLLSSISKGWLFDDKAVAERLGMDINKFASLRSWILFAPWAHPMWYFYLLVLVHLRPIEGMPAPKINLPNASHELFLIALDPGYPVPLNDRPHYLTPLNFVAQFYAQDDKEAIRMIDEAALDVVDGRLNPDTDYTQHWIARFGSSNIKGDPARAGETKIILSPEEGEPVEIIIPPHPVKKEGGLPT